ncbi:MAG TPA: hypothetical protein VF535_12320 [Allosphingosinicella sp.]
MSEPAPAPENRFPAKAVSTYGGPARCFAELSYMHGVEAILVDYLKNYPQAAPAVALSGGHGTGKTYLLTWLGKRATELRSAGARVIYAKTDSPNLADAYRSLISNLTRRDLLEVVHAALLRRGLSRVQAAAATQSDGEIIDQTGSMEAAYAEKVLDPNELHLELRQTLQGRSVATAVSQKIAYAIGLLDHAHYGEAAYDWLAGQGGALPDETLKAPLFGGEQVDGSQVVVEALETIAALFQVANIPLLVMLDQVENFIPPDDVKGASSVMKKLAEQLGEQAAMVVMAGTPAAWEPLPRDLWPRFQNRKAFPVGNLTVDETSLLLGAYLVGSERFNPEIVGLINDLSGGNAREVLQIAHEAWEACNGDLDRLTGDDIRQAAKAAGSLDDRANLAQQILNDVAQERKLSIWRPEDGGGTTRVWTVEASSGTRAVVVVAVATDARAESLLAGEVAGFARRYQAEGDAREMIVVTVGYSSEHVQSLLTGISRTIVFREHSFKSELIGGLEAIMAAPPAAAGPPARATDSEVERKLADMERAIGEILKAREEAQTKASETLARNAEAFVSSEHRQREAKTKLQLREGLDDLSHALTRETLEEERHVLRSLLIDNEAYVKNDDFDYLGNMYLDALDIQGLLSIQAVSDPHTIYNRITDLRSRLIAVMRRAITTPSSQLTNSVSFRGIISVGAAVSTAAAFYAMGVFTPFYMAQIELMLASLVIGLLTAGFIFLYIELLMRPSFRFGGLRREIDRIRNSIGADDPARRPGPEVGEPSPAPSSEGR